MLNRMTGSSLLLGLVLLSLVMTSSGCSSGDPRSVYKEYRESLGKLDYEKCVDFLAPDEQQAISSLVKTYGDYREWVAAHPGEIWDLEEIKELLQTANTATRMLTRGDIYIFYLRAAAVVGGGEPKEMPDDVKISGDTAILQFTEGREREMVKIEGKWYVKLPPRMLSAITDADKTLRDIINNKLVKTN